MKFLRIPCIAFMLASSATLCFAQSGTNPPADTLEKPTAVPHSSGTGTAPDGMGSTGWTGGSRGQTETTGQGSSRTDPDAAQNQPSMATGADLQGPPARFPAEKTPE